YTFLKRSAPPIAPDLLTDAVAYWSFDNTGVDVINAHDAVLNAFAGYSDNGVVNQCLALVNWAQQQYADVPDSNDFSFTDGVDDLAFTFRILTQFAVAKTGTRFL